MTSVRVLVVLPFYGGSLPVGRYAAQALLDEGHIVDVFEAPSFFSAFSALKTLQVGVDRLTQLENSFLHTVSQAIYAKVENFEPDLVLCLAQAPLNRATLNRLKRDKVTTAMWFVEDYQVFPYWRAFAPSYDYFFTIQKEPFLDLLRAEGAQGSYLPLAALPSFHKPLKLDAADRRRYGADVSFLGAGYPNRRAAFRQLTGFDFKIWGSDWEGDALLARHLQAGGARIEPEEAVKIFNATRINLNLHSSVRTDRLISRHDFVNPRTFELAACGAFQLTDQRSLMPELFADGELAIFTSMDELRAALDHYLAHPDKRAAMAEKARARVVADHTYQHRMRTLVDAIRAARPDWPAPRRSLALPDETPDDLRRELEQLLTTLNLPADVDFPDLIARIRQQSGRLNSLETSLLFLDEWRKQYKQG
ncbi:MAG: glycosyltransferase [Deltaproteobacteria bacterium]|jgi:spore maturation protein CgeB|nr:glycosyltransferase [Deltaproteobacteria bacterium]